MKANRRLKILYGIQNGKCIWCGQQTWHKDYVKNITDREFAEFLHLPYSRKHLFRRIKQRSATLEHLWPKCHRGSNKAINLALACSSCNSKREHHGCAISYEVLGLFYAEKQRHIVRSRHFCNSKLKHRYKR